MGIAAAINILGIVAKAVETGATFASAWQAGNELINQMVEEDRDPTDEELAALQDRIASVHEQIQNA